MNKESFLDAAEDGEISTIRQGLEAGLNADTKDEHQRTALMKAAKYGHLEVVQLLLAEGADANSVITAVPVHYIGPRATGITISCDCSFKTTVM